ncbi:hypothetical protein MKX01_036764 [Papaver californicum]|nr:hypothetical protein MKX01_036764 [Papaver californicum]
MESVAKKFDVIVIGAGIMGSCTAYQLAKRGKKVLLLEQFDFLHHRGSSHGESRTIRCTYPEDYYSEMVLESSKLWEEAEAEIGYRVYFKSRHLDMGVASDKSLRAVITSCESNSIPHRVLNREQVIHEFSGVFEIPDSWIGLSTDLGGVLKSTKAVSMFQTLAVKNGAVLKDYMEVNGIKRDNERGGIRVCTKNGSKFWGEKCVVTVGAWMSKLVKTASNQVLPVKPLHTSICYWRIKDGYQDNFSFEKGFPSFSSYGDPYIYGTPSLEFPGLLKIAVHGGYPCDPDKRTWAPALLGNEVTSWIKEKFADKIESYEPVLTQSCMYSMTPDGDFLIDFLGGEEFGKDVVIAGGFSGHGFKMGPVIGRILAEMVMKGEARGVELKYFRLDRFEENPRGNVKDYEDQVNSVKSKL